MKVKSLEKYQALARYSIVKDTQVQSETLGEQMEKVQYLPDIETELANLEFECKT